MIQLDRVARQHGPHLLFRELSWKIVAGARIGFVGPNGAGKSTILRMINGDEAPDEGAVHRVRGTRVGFLPQDVESFSGGTVLDTVVAGAEEARELAVQLAELEERLADRSADEETLRRDTERYGSLRDRWDVLGGDRLESKAGEILGGLGVQADRFQEPVEQLSGGWRMRVLLARLLLASPNVLLLDEPTNHLDLEAIDWLEGFLAVYPGALIAVSHDRYFLNRVVNEIVELENGALTTYAGAYDAYVQGKALREEQLKKAAKRQAKERAHTERFIERFRYKSSKAKQVQSRVKALEKQETIRTAESVQRIRFGFPAAPRSGDIVVRIEEAKKAYGEIAVYTDLNLMLRRGDRMALIGPNGAGKSTLLKMLAGRTRPDGGTVELGHNVDVHYYAQHQLEELDASSTVLGEMVRAAPHLEAQRLRSLLGSFLFPGEAVDKRVSVLSGGERARLALAKMLVRPANLLLLDEPTNHLDLRSREVLEDALNEFEGTLLLISHDRYFINRVTTCVARIADGQAERYDGDYDEYLAWKARREAEGIDSASAKETHSNSQSGSDTEETPQSRRDSKRSEAEERNRLYRERKEAQKQLKPVENRIELVERRIGDLTESQATEAVYSNPDQAAAAAREKSNLESELAELYERWESLSAQLS